MDQANKDRSARANFRFAALVFSLTGGLFVAACAPSGEIDNYVERRAGWIGFIGGRDIRAACEPGAPERYRFTYNANRIVQVRVYDLVRRADDAGALRTRVLTGNQLPLTLSFEDLPGLLAPIDRAAILPRAEAAGIVAALDADGFRGRPPVGARYDSGGYYWLVAGCRDGRFLFNAWRHGDGRFEDLTFPARLFARDPIAEAVPVRAPRPVWREPDALDRRTAGSADDAPAFIRFDVVIEEDGVAFGGNR